MAVRRLMREQIKVGLPELFHLMLGDECLLAGGCSVCTDATDEDPGAMAAPGLRWVLRVARARAVWDAQRDALLAAWWQDRDARGECGAHGLPVFAQVLFDDVKLPAFSSSWPSEVQGRWYTIRANLDTLQEHLRLHPQEK